MEPFPDFSNVHILVIGDVMLDRYWWGDVNRISPEAPVPVVSLDNISSAAGGSANVAANIVGLGAKATLVGITGDDAEAGAFPQVLSDAGIQKHKLFSVPGRRSTVKTRIVAHNQQIARIDQETTTEIEQEQADSILAKVSSLIEQADVTVISDYAKGFLTPGFTRSCIQVGRECGRPVLVDPKGRDYSKYRGATLLTPNQREAADACGADPNNPKLLEIAVDKLLNDLELSALLITRGEQGMALMENGTVRTIPATPRTVYNVTGAGDTAIATIAVGVGSGMSLFDAATLANRAAGIVVENLGTTPVTRQMLLDEH